MKKFLVLLVFAILFSLSLSSAQETDTAWTQDLWQLGSTIYKVKFTPDGKNVAVAMDGGVYFLDILTGNMVKQFQKSINYNTDFVFSENGDIMVTTSHSQFGETSTLAIWDLIKGDTIRSFKNIAFDKIQLLNDSILIGIGRFGNDTSKVYTLNIKTGKLSDIQGMPDANKYIGVLAFAVLKDYNLFSVVSEYDNDQTRYVELWDLKTLKKITTLGTHSSKIRSIAFSSDGKYLASASTDGVINIWDLNTKKLFKSLLHDSIKDGYLQVAFSPKSGYLVSSGGLKTYNTKIWDIRNFKEVYQYNNTFGATDGLDIAKDSLYIAISGGRILSLLNSYWTPTGIQQPPQESYQLIFPNPSGNEITIPIEQGLQPISLDILSNTGQVAKSINKIEPIENNIKIDISSLLIGSYFVSVYYPKKTISYKFVKIG